MRPLVFLALVGLVAAPAHAQSDEVVFDAPLPPPAPGPPPPPTYYDAALALLDGPPDFEGVLTDDDPQHEGKPYDAFTVEVEAGHEVTVTMTSDEFDTYLIVRAPGGQEWSNDDFGSTRVSQVSFTVATSGMYEIWATAFSQSGQGAYEIHVSEVEAAILMTESGRLDYDDEQLVKGEYADVVTLAPRTQQPFFIELMPLGFAGYLRVTSPSGARQTAQSGYDGSRTVRVGPLQPEPGTWTVDVTTVSPDEVGAYDLRVVVLEDR